MLCAEDVFQMCGGAMSEARSYANQLKLWQLALGFLVYPETQAAGPSTPRAEATGATQLPARWEFRCCC